MFDAESARLPQVTVMHGYNAIDQAFLIDDYPYGSGLRCKKRVWVETATKGAKKGQQRLVEQTSNPKKPGEPWNKPHPGQYAPLLLMYQTDNGHVHGAHVSAYGITPAQHTRYLLNGMYAGMSDDQRAVYDRILAASRVHEDPWRKWDALVDHLAGQVKATGDLVVPESGVFEYEFEGAATRNYVSDYELPALKAAVAKALETATV